MLPQELNTHVSTLDTSSPKETQSSVAKPNRAVTKASTVTTSAATATATATATETETVAPNTLNVNNANDLAESLKNLKKVIPLMGKYSVPVIPINYAVWYTYVTETNNEVTKRLNEAMSEGKLIARTETESIYNDCIEPKNTLDAEKVRRHLEAMLLEIASNFDDTINNTQDFSKIIDEHLNRFERQGDPNLTMKEAMFLIQKLITGSDLIKKTTKTFIAQLENTRQQITTLQNELHKARSEAIHDALTGLFNRRALELESAELGEQKIPYSIAMFDIDHFKNVNDSYGHSFGDLVVKAVAQTALKTFPKSCHVYRLGGDEFVVILKNTTIGPAVRLANSCRQNTMRINIRAIHNNEVVSSIRTSYGVAEWNGRTSFAETLERADQMLYKAKSQGRNRVMPIVM